MNHTGEDTLKAADVYVKAIAVMMQSPETKIQGHHQPVTVDDRELRERMREDVSEDEAAAMPAALQSDRKRVLAGCIAVSIQPVRRD